MSLKIRGLLAVSIGVVLGLSLGLGSGVLAERQGQDDSLPWEQARLLAEVLERVKRDYVDSVDDAALLEAAIRGMVADLDSHSAFLDSEEYEEIRISTTGNYSGVGLEVSLEDERVVVVAPIEGSPAEEAGILSGDQIISVDQMPVDTGNLNDTVARLRGRSGTTVKVGIVRGEAAEDPRSFELQRSRVELHSVKSELLQPGIGYLRITHFSETTARDLYDAVDGLLAEAGGELDGLVLDLRDNPGGVLDAAVEVSDAFLDAGIIVSASGRVPDARFRHEATPGDLLDGAPVTILINGGSASASEIVAGALQDNGRAELLGTLTFGKGSVQTVVPLSEGRAIKLTTSRYYTPSGRSIHELGIKPDVEIDAADNAADAQLAAALSSLNARKTVRTARH
jgi:carboxyl-terminal processing protease